MSAAGRGRHLNDPQASEGHDHNSTPARTPRPPSTRHAPTPTSTPARTTPTLSPAPPVCVTSLRPTFSMLFPLAFLPSSPRSVINQHFSLCSHRLSYSIYCPFHIYYIFFLILYVSLPSPFSWSCLSSFLPFLSKHALSCLFSPLFLFSPSVIKMHFSPYCPCLSSLLCCPSPAIYLFLSCTFPCITFLQVISLPFSLFHRTT